MSQSINLTLSHNSLALGAEEQKHIDTLLAEDIQAIQQSKNFKKQVKKIFGKNAIIDVEINPANTKSIKVTELNTGKTADIKITKEERRVQNQILNKTTQAWNKINQTTSSTQTEYDFIKTDHHSLGKLIKTNEKIHKYIERKKLDIAFSEKEIKTFKSLLTIDPIFDFTLTPNGVRINNKQIRAFFKLPECEEDQDSSFLFPMNEQELRALLGPGANEKTIQSILNSRYYNYLENIIYSINRSTITKLSQFDDTFMERVARCYNFTRSFNNTQDPENFTNLIKNVIAIPCILENLPEDLYEDRATLKFRNPELDDLYQMVVTIKNNLKNLINRV